MLGDAHRPGITIDPLADTMEIASQGMRSKTGDIFSQGMNVQSGPWAGEIYSQGMMMTTGDIYSQGMEIMFLGGTPDSPSQGGAGSFDWSDNSPNLGGTTNSRPPSQGCAASNCNSNGNSTNPQTTSDPPKDEEIGSSNLSFTITGGTPEGNSIPLVLLLHPQFFGFDNQSSDPPPPPSGAIATGTSDPIPEPASLALLGPAVLWFGWVRRRRERGWQPCCDDAERGYADTVSGIRSPSFHQRSDGQAR